MTPDGRAGHRRSQRNALRCRRPAILIAREGNWRPAITGLQQTRADGTPSAARSARPARTGLPIRPKLSRVRASKNARGVRIGGSARTCSGSVCGWRSAAYRQRERIAVSRRFRVRGPLRLSCTKCERNVAIPGSSSSLQSGASEPRQCSAARSRAAGRGRDRRRWCGTSVALLQACCLPSLD